MRDKFTQLALVENTLTTRQCVVCGEVFDASSWKTYRKFPDKKTCSKKCQYRLIGGRPKKHDRPIKFCCVCGGLIVVSDHQQPDRIRRQKTCSRACSGRLKSQTARQQLELAEKRCAWCGAKFQISTNERSGYFRKRRWCSSVCMKRLHEIDRLTRDIQSGQTSRVSRSAPKFCDVCGTMFVRDSKEPSGAYRARKTCSKQCGYRLSSINRRANRTSQSDRRRIYPPEWNESLRSSIRERDGNQCVICESTDRLSVHHIDYRKHDCRPDNLITLCISCHSKTTFGDRDDWQYRFRAILVERGIIIAEELAA